MTRWPSPRRRAVVALATLALALMASPASAHAGSLSGSYRSAAVPSWLLTMTGAAIIGASFLVTSLLTDHQLIQHLNRRSLPLPNTDTLRAVLARLAGAVGVLGLAFVLAVGFIGPATGEANAAVLSVWAGWWAGYTMSVYLLVDSWPALDPWRTIAGLAPVERLREYPERLGAWPAVGGLLVLVYVEVVSPVASAPRLLAGIVVIYTVVAVTGALAVGTEDWFGRVDPIAAVFRYYGRLAPIQRTDAGIRLRVPGTALTEATEPEGADGTAFIVALLWVTTFDGFVTTPAWRSLAGPVVDAGVPPLVVYAIAMVAGFGLFLAVYRIVSRWARRTADTYVTTGFIEGWFAPSLLPIAAGYHLAHFLGYFLSLGPALVAVLGRPFAAPTTVPVAVLPGWFGGLQLAFVVVGHLLAVWVAHALSFEAFTGRLQPLRSQYPFVLAMLLYTAVSMWIVSQPFLEPPYL